MYHLRKIRLNCERRDFLLHVFGYIKWFLFAYLDLIMYIQKDGRNFLLLVVIRSWSLSMAKMVANVSPITAEAIGLTEKKVGMSPDDPFITAKKPKAKHARAPIKRGTNLGSAAHNFKVQSFMDSRSSLRQGALAKRRSKFQDTHFPIAAEVARKAATTPFASRGHANRIMANRANLKVAVSCSPEQAVLQGQLSKAEVEARSPPFLFLEAENAAAAKAGFTFSAKKLP